LPGCLGYVHAIDLVAETKHYTQLRFPCDNTNHVRMCRVPNYTHSAPTQRCARAPTVATPIHSAVGYADLAGKAIPVSQLSPSVRHSRRAVHAVSRILHNENAGHLAR